MRGGKKKEKAKVKGKKGGRKKGRKERTNEGRKEGRKKKYLFTISTLLLSFLGQKARLSHNS